jgi:hypothetical protein
MLATDVLGPINVGATWGAGITAAAGTGLAHPLFAILFTYGKSFPEREALQLALSPLRALQKFRACCTP